MELLAPREFERPARTAEELAAAQERAREYSRQKMRCVRAGAGPRRGVRGAAGGPAVPDPTDLTGRPERRHRREVEADLAAKRRLVAGALAALPEGLRAAAAAPDSAPYPLGAWLPTDTAPAEVLGRDGDGGAAGAEEEAGGAAAIFQAKKRKRRRAGQRRQEPGGP